MNEPSLFTPKSTLPDTVLHRLDADAAPHRSVHNCYGFLMAKASYEGLSRLEPRKRPFLLTRSGFAGIQRYASSWTGDNRSSFSQYRLTVPMLLNMGLSGQSMVGVDIGGFWAHPSPELMARWIQLGAFYPYSRNHTRAGTPPQELWHFGEEVESIARCYLELRYSLLPYLYTSLRESCRCGIPLMRPLFMEFPKDPGCYDPKTVESEFLIGPDLLLAPVLRRGAGGREVYLPSSCRWYEWWTGRVLEGGQTHSAKAPLEILPLYARAGSAIPMGPAAQHTEQVASASVTIRLIPDARIDGSLYIDDGRTMEYESGQYSLIRVAGSCDAARENLTLTIKREEGALEPMLGSHPALGVEIFLPELASEKLSVELNGGVLGSWRWQGAWLVVDDLHAGLEGELPSLQLEVVRREGAR
jgi:alpha-glucosidase